MKTLECVEDREGKSERDQVEDEEKGEIVIENEEKREIVVTVDTTPQRLKDKPPEDDCCPICLDDFQLPCRTSCGHWFCASCILEHWRYLENCNNPCTCPVCVYVVNDLVPESSVLSHPGEEVGEIVKNIQKYNCHSDNDLSGFLWDFLWIYSFLLLVLILLYASLCLYPGRDCFAVVGKDGFSIGALLGYGSVE